MGEAVVKSLDALRVWLQLLKLRHPKNQYTFEIKALLQYFLGEITITITKRGNYSNGTNFYFKMNKNGTNFEINYKNGTNLIHRSFNL
jgi:hypothetical protein